MTLLIGQISSSVVTLLTSDGLFVMTDIKACFDIILYMKLKKSDAPHPFALAEIGSPERNSNNREYLFLNEHHQLVFFNSPFHYSLRCHILVHVRSIFVCLQ